MGTGSWSPHSSHENVSLPLSVEGKLLLGPVLGASFSDKTADPSERNFCRVVTVTASVLRCCGRPLEEGRCRAGGFARAWIAAELLSRLGSGGQTVEGGLPDSWAP